MLIFLLTFTKAKKLHVKVKNLSYKQTYLCT